MSKKVSNEPFPRSVLMKKKDRELHFEQGVPAKFCARGDLTISNAESAFPELVSHRKTTTIASDDPSFRILGMRVYDGKLMVVTLHGQYLDFYILRNGSLTKYFTSIEQYPIDYQLDSYMRDLLFTSDTSEELVVGANADKLLFFPICKYMVLSGGLPYTVAALPAQVPVFEHATISGGRLYGTIGQKLYISSGRSVFDFTYDGEDETDPRNAFSTPITSFTERQTPVTALRSYRGSVLIFRENAIQRVVGTENPFAVREMAQTGTGYAESIRELNGSLYFIGDGVPMRLSGSAVTPLPPLRDGFAPTGHAAVFDGKYWFSCVKNGECRILSYDPLCEGYGELTVDGEVLALAAGQTLYALVDVRGVKSLRALSGARVDSGFAVEWPVFREDLCPKRLRDAALHLYLGSGASATLKAKRRNDAGQNTTVTLAQSTGNGRECVLRYHGNLPAAALVSLRVEGAGEVRVKGVYARCTCAAQKKC